MKTTTDRVVSWSVMVLTVLGAASGVARGSDCATHMAVALHTPEIWQEFDNDFCSALTDNPTDPNRSITILILRGHFP